jgi:hypothetical protein
MKESPHIKSSRCTARREALPLTQMSKHHPDCIPTKELMAWAEALLTPHVIQAQMLCLSCFSFKPGERIVRISQKL